jgi:hypothetical protein
LNSVQNIQLVLTSKVVLNNTIYICVTGQPVVFKNASSRIVIFASYITSLVLMAAYSAFLISSLAVQDRNLPFRDLQELLRDGSYRLGVLQNGSDFNMFNVWGVNYLWPNYLVGVGLGWGDKLVGGKNVPYLKCFIRQLRQS